MRIVLLQLCLLISTCIYSHNSYFSFAEMQYNQQSSCLEISICVSTHDLDFYFRQKVQDIRLEKAMENDSSGISPEEDNELRSMGFASTSEIEYVSARNLNICCDLTRG